MKRNIIATAEQGRKILTDRIDLTYSELTVLMQKASGTEKLPTIMTSTDVVDLAFRLMSMSFDAGLAVGYRKAKRDK